MIMLDEHFVGFSASSSPKRNSIMSAFSTRVLDFPSRCDRIESGIGRSTAATKVTLADRCCVGVNLFISNDRKPLASFLDQRDVTGAASFGQRPDNRSPRVPMYRSTALSGIMS